MGLVRLLTRELSIPVARAAGLTETALRQPRETRAMSLAVFPDSAARLVVDLARYHSTFVAALSAAIHRGGPRRRGRLAAARGAGAVACGAPRTPRRKL